MPSRFRSVHGRAAGALLLAALGLSACAGQPTPTNLATTTSTIAAPGSPQDFAVNVGDRVHFLVDSTSLTPEATAILDRQAQWLARYPRYAITIEGHADERGTREYNISLGAGRAETIRNYLAARGIPAGRIRTISYGKERPVAVCDAESCWTQNRRGVTALGGAAGS